MIVYNHQFLFSTHPSKTKNWFKRRDDSFFLKALVLNKAIPFPEGLVLCQHLTPAHTMFIFGSLVGVSTGSISTNARTSFCFATQAACRSWWLSNQILPKMAGNTVVLSFKVNYTEYLTSASLNGAHFGVDERVKQCKW